MTEMSVGVRFVANSISPAVYELQSERNWAGNKKEMRKRWKEGEGGGRSRERGEGGGVRNTELIWEDAVQRDQESCMGAKTWDICIGRNTQTNKHICTVKGKGQEISEMNRS